MAILKKTAMLLVSVSFAVISIAKPTEFNQCDPEWKDKRLGNKSDWPTICEAGD